MSITLHIGDFAYSSWSLRGWLLLDAFGIPFQQRRAHMRTDAFETLKSEMSPSRLVPALRITGDDHKDVIVWETLAIAETLAEMHPAAGHWPANATARSVARSVSAEMHAGFSALRGACPMNMYRAYEGFEASVEVQDDLDRLAQIWSYACGFGGDGPFLFGAFSAADAFFVPVASRIATYGLPVGPEDTAYVAALLGHPSVRRWRAMALADGHVQAHYEMDLPARPNPHDPQVSGEVVPGRPAENDACPYSGKPVDPDCVVAVGNRVLGYCNPFCAAKSAADPMAWPGTVRLLEAQSG